MELQASREEQRVQRTTSFHILSISALHAFIARIEAEKKELVGVLSQVTSAIPEAYKVDEEESMIKAGETTMIQIPILSKAFYDQICQASNQLTSLDELENNARRALANIERLQREKARNKEKKALELAEQRAGRGENFYFGTGSTLRDQAEKEDNYTKVKSEQEESERRRTIEGLRSNFNPIIRAYNEREMDALSRLCNGVDVYGNQVASGDVPTGGVDGATNAMRNLFFEQQKSQMISNMMFSQHASQMAVSFGFQSCLQSLLTIRFLGY